MKVQYFHDFYGSTASIKKWGLRWILTIRDPYGDLYHKKNYETLKGAKIALGRMGEGWMEK